MKALDGCYSILGIQTNSSITEVKVAFKKKSYSLHPDRHPGTPNAFSNFINVTESFVEIIKDFESRAMQSGSEDPEVSSTLEKCEEYVPGEVDLKGNGISCKIQHFKLWKRIVKERYPDAVMGKQRKNSISSLKQSLGKEVKGTRFIIRFKLKGAEDTFLKANLSIYDNDTLIVTGTSYYLWTIDNFKEISTEVQNNWDEAHRVIEDPTEVKDEEGPEEDSNHDTLGSTEANSSRCCGAEVTKLSTKLDSVDSKVGGVFERLNLIMDDQNRLKQIDIKYSSIESKLDQILQRLDSPTYSAQSDGAQTYLVGPDRFEELKEWFKEFCMKELKEEESEEK